VETIFFEYSTTDFLTQPALAYNPPSCQLGCVQLSSNYNKQYFVNNVLLNGVHNYARKYGKSISEDYHLYPYCLYQFLK